MALPRLPAHTKVVWKNMSSFSDVYTMALLLGSKGDRSELRCCSGPRFGTSLDVLPRQWRLERIPEADGGCCSVMCLKQSSMCQLVPIDSGRCTIDDSEARLLRLALSIKVLVQESCRTLVEFHKQFSQWLLSIHCVFHPLQGLVTFTCIPAPILEECLMFFLLASANRLHQSRGFKATWQASTFSCSLPLEDVFSTFPVVSP